MNFISLFYSDVQAAYPTQSHINKLIRAITNSSLHACFLVRLCQVSPGWFFFLFRRLLIAFHGIDVGKGFTIGSGLSLPHPVGVVIGGGCRVGCNCTIFQSVTLGVAHGKYPKIGNDVIIYPNSVIVGDIEIPDGKRVRALSFLAPIRSESAH